MAVEKLTAKGVEFISLKEHIDTTTPTGRFTEVVAAGIGGFGGAIVGLVVGSDFGSIGAMVGACLCSKADAEGAPSVVQHMKDFTSGRKLKSRA